MEIEVKYQAGPEQAERLWQSPLIAPWLGESRRIPMEAVYYDTPQGDCAQAGFALRLRREGERRVCAVKGGDLAGEDGVARRVEIEAPADSLAQGVQALLRDPRLPGQWAAALDGPLSQTVRMTFLRRAADYRRQGLWVELCYDQGEMKAGGRRASIGECELELKQGSEQAFLELAAALEAQLGWSPWKQSKYARAKELMR